MLAPTLFSLLCLTSAALVDAVPGRLNASSYLVPHFGSSARAAKKRQLDGIVAAASARQQQQSHVAAASAAATASPQQSSPTKFSFDENVKLQYVENELAYDCPNCADDPAINIGAARWTMPLLKLGEKRYYLGIFFKANWYRASQYCRYHGMHLASINSQEENDKLEKHIRDFGLAHEHFWTSGTDQAEEGTFFWMANGRPITFENWNAGEPNNFRYENGEEEHCLELWNRDGKGLKWNDSPCSFETFFVCEVQ